MTTATGLVHLVVGDEELLVARGIAAAVAAVKQSGDVVVHEFVASEMVPSDLFAAASPSLFAEQRVVVIRNLHDAKKDLAAAVLTYVGAPEPDVVLVAAHAGGAKGKSLLEGLRGAGATLTSAAKITKHRDRVGFVRDEIRRLGGRCSDDAGEALLAAVGNDLRELAAACSQLVADTGGTIDVGIVNRYYRGRAEVSGFTVADLAIVGDVPGALEALRWALHVGVDPVPIADALADGVRTISRVASAGRASAFQLASTLGMPSWKVERAQRHARGWSPDGLAVAMIAAAECNAAVKGGADNRGYALERAVFAIAGARSHGSR